MGQFDFPSDGEMEITQRVDAADGTVQFAYNDAWDLPNTPEYIQYLQTSTLQIEVHYHSKSHS